MRWIAVLAVAGVIALPIAVAAAASGGEDADPRILEAGRFEVRLPEGYRVTGDRVAVPVRDTSSTGEGSAAASDSSTDASAIPLDEDKNALADLLSAYGKFRRCMEDLGVRFIGVPDQSSPDAPTNDPTYIDNLRTCAARSNILQALQDAESANENLPASEIERRNKAYLKWRRCLVDRGWKVPEPTPDSEGRLFSFGGAGGPQMEPPPGQDLLEGSDLEECAAKVQRVLEG